MRKFLGSLFIFSLIPLVTGLIFLASQEWNKAESVQKVLDDNISIDTIQLEETSYMTDNQGKIISEISLAKNRVNLSDEEIPTFLKDLFVTIEDRQFYHHEGIDAVAISRAVLVNSQSTSIEQGASTITQQLARNVYLTHERTYDRKITELLYAYQMERLFSKEEILDLYINAIYFNNGTYGIEAASQFYFNTSAKKLSKAQLAFLAAIPNNPERYNPLKHFKATKNRQERILRQMVEAEFLSEKQYKKLVQEKITLNVRTKVDNYPDYVTYVHHELKQLVAAREGLTARLASKDQTVRKQAEKQLQTKVTKLLNSGVTIHTALDPHLQTTAKQALNNGIAYGDIEGAAVVIQHHTQELVSLIGGKNYKKNSFNRAYQSYRQPGSAIKPLLVYAPYIEKTGASVYSQVSGANYCKNGYCPQNYGGATYGMVPLKTAFARSYNTPAVRLLDATGIETSFEYLDAFQFEQVSERDHLLAAAVGGFTYGMSPLELTRAFTSFYDGSYQPARAIVKVTDREGKTLYKWKDKQKQVWSPATVAKMRELLHEVTVRGTAKAAYFPTGYIGGKTGTTNGVKDIWFVGLTDSYTTGVWVGRDKPSSIESIYYSSPHVRIWRNISQQAQAR
ncbi:transglycosylase domain-containing protein [Peribacillus asahii]|uniref:transglycosylase domain-containing protein n=1 Tax=Peribacillus asahii TaxID=228899 RepID=UPI00382C2BB5